MSLIQRAKRILLQPNETWPEIAAEPASAGSLYTGYVMILALIPALATFIGMTLIGVGGFGINVRLPFFTGLTQAVLSYGLMLVAVFVLALIAEALAPTFGGTKDRLNALKLVAYASTASFVGGIFALVPALWILSLAASLYGIYLLYTGAPVLMRIARDKAIAYTAVLVVCGIVAMVILGAITNLFMPSPAAMTGSAGAMSIQTPGGEVSVDVSKLDAMARQMEEAGKRMEAAQARGDSEAAQKAMGDMMGALGAASGPAIDPQQLKALLPESLGDLQRDEIEAQGSQIAGLAGSTARAVYVNAERRITLSVSDLGGMAGLAAMAGWAGATVDRETADEVEKVYKDGQRTVREQYRKDGSYGEVAVILENGLLVQAEGDAVAQPALARAVQNIDTARLLALKQAAK